jgi:hypothetical protein
MPFSTVNNSAVRCCWVFPWGSRPNDDVGRMSLLLAQSCFVVANFWARTSEVKDDVEDGVWLKDIWTDGIEAELWVDGREGARAGGLIIWTSSEVSGLLIQVLQLLQNKSVGPRRAAHLVQYIVLFVISYYCKSII